MIREQESSEQGPPPSNHQIKGRWLSVSSLSAASFVDEGEEQALAILWPYMQRSLNISVGQLGPILGISKLVMTPLPVLISILAWLPLFRAYRADRQSLRDRLTRQRAELLEKPALL